MHIFKAGKVMIWIKFSVLAHWVLGILPHGVCPIDVIEITTNIIKMKAIMRLAWSHVGAWWSFFCWLWQRIKPNIFVIFQRLGICYWITFPRSIFLKRWPNFIRNSLILLKNVSLIFSELVWILKNILS